jgi:hypothetical protein
MTDHNLTIRQLQARMNRARDAWESAPEILRSTLVSLNDTPIVVREKDGGIRGLVTWDDHGLYVTHPTEPERMWLHEQVLREPRVTLRMIELARAMYENFYVPPRQTKAPFRVVLLVLEVTSPRYPIIAWPEDPSHSYYPQSSRSYYSTESSISALESHRTEWIGKLPTVPEPFSAQIDLFRHSPFRDWYLGAAIRTAQGAISLHVNVPNEPWDEADPGL